jgi:60 kDa SS-A/Ro ribonucleoprotein
MASVNRSKSKKKVIAHRVTSKVAKTRTHGGAITAKITDAEELLRRSVMACMLWEDSFYEDGKSTADRIKEYIPNIPAARVAEIAIEARSQMKLRHVPLLIVREMARLDSHKHLVAKTLCEVIQRPDEISEFLSLYWST